MKENVTDTIDTFIKIENKVRANDCEIVKKEAKQMTEEDDIKRGVAILRKIRNNRKG